VADTFPDDFCDELARLDLLIHREMLRLRAAYQLSLDEYRGLYISDEQADALVARTQPLAGIDDPVAKLTRDAEVLAARIGDASPLGRTALTLGLDRFERDVLLVALAPERHLKYETLYAYLNNNVARRHPTVDLALRLCGRGGSGERTRLHFSARLFRDGMLETTDAVSEWRPELGRSFTIAPAMAAALQGLPPFDPRLSGWVEPIGDGSTTAVLLGPDTTAKLSRLAEVLGRESRAPLVLLEAEAAQAPAAAASHLLALLGRGALRLDGNGLSAERPPISTLTLVARLRDTGIFLDAEDWTAETPRRFLPGLLAAVWQTGVPALVAVQPNTQWRSLTRELPTVRIRLDEPDAAERRVLWSRALEREQVEVPALPVTEVVEHFRLGPAQIAGAVRAIAALGPLGDEHAARQRLFAAARDQSSGDLGHLAMPVRQRHAWSDLVLPPVVLRRLREVSGAIRARAKVFGDWGFGHRGGRGLMVLFAGSSGTGKTMSAQVIAREIGLDLYRIELAGVVSKYIGETEKNLHRIFEAARTANVILFFDEADALLGRRSEVKDAHDRYANIEVAYLLQKMEEHDGVVILASNLSKNMDQAFARRMHYVVEFPPPDPALRERLWRHVFPPEVPLDGDIDFAFLACQFELTGGDVKTIALDAAFCAASQERSVAMADLIDAVSRQMLKQGRPLGASDFKQYRGTFANPDGVALLS
jgi:ATPase family protein associated with various cellular activities (AAA)/winged helix domain-containing protein